MYIKVNIDFLRMHQKINGVSLPSSLNLFHNNSKLKTHLTFSTFQNMFFTVNFIITLLLNSSHDLWTALPKLLENSIQNCVISSVFVLKKLYWIINLLSQALKELYLIKLNIKKFKNTNYRLDSQHLSTWSICTETLRTFGRSPGSTVDN